MIEINKNDFSKIIEIYNKNNIDWYVNIIKTNSKTLSYSPLHDEISLDSSDDIWISVVIIKDHKKSSFNIDWFWIEKIEASISQMLEIIDYAEYDENITLPDITDSVTKDFSNLELEKIDYEYLKNQFLKFKNYNFDDKIIIEQFSAWVSSGEQIYINSKWAVKVQKDNSSFYFMEIFAENGESRETHYDYKTLLAMPEIKIEDIEKLEKEVLAKLESNWKISSWNYDITLERDVVSEFIDIILWNLWSESIDEWMSLFSKNTLGDKIFDDKFTLINDPDLKWYIWNVLFDKEGITVEKKVLFDKWVWRDKFYDYKNSLKKWVKADWNTIANIVFDAVGNELYLKWSKIIIMNLMAFHTVDSSTWKFSLSWEWYLLDNEWNKTEYIKNISLSWDIISLFNSIKSIWNDFKTDGNFKVPSITFYNQTIIW